MVINPRLTLETEETGRVKHWPPSRLGSFYVDAINLGHSFVMTYLCFVVRVKCIEGGDFIEQSVARFTVPYNPVS